MLDLRFVQENNAYVAEKLSHRSGSYPVQAIIALASRRKEIIAIVELLKAKRNSVSAQIASIKKQGGDALDLVNEMKDNNSTIKTLDEELITVESAIKDTMFSIPNLPHDSVPIGSEEADNIELRKSLEPTVFDFEPQAHWDLGNALKFFDSERAAKITGSRFTVYRSWGAKLERAIMNFMLDTHADSGYIEIFPPFLVNRESMIGTGQLPKFEEDMYAIKNTDFYLIPTAEVPVTNLHRNEILTKEELTIKYCAYTACFRAESGSAGRDTRGLIRNHQFNKVELVKFTLPENSYDELEALTLNAEQILKLLKLPYRVVSLCTGDIGFSSAKTYDIEVWMPSYSRYVEISSCSNFEDYQARRANIRYRDSDGKIKFVHTLNGSALAVGRTTAAVMENYQNADGTITVPDVLRKYLGVDILK